jgi:putative nucleotidyltransferase with HDIG domain
MSQAAAAALSKKLPALTRSAIENLHDSQLLADPELEACMQVIVDRLCLSLQLSKPVGLATWAMRQGRRVGVGKTCVLLDAAAQAVGEFSAGQRFGFAQTLAFLETLKIEVRASLCSLDEGPRKTVDPVEPESSRAMLAMLGEADPLACAHCKATGEWARRLSTAMRLSNEMTEFIVQCAVLHDIGKVSTPQHILLKAGPLTKAEREVVREHAAAGQRILAQIDSLSRCALIVRAHHERYDGTGYPDGLAGDAIPLEARVVAVADAFHAMISERPYRKAIAPRQALEILREGRGTQWDPMVVDALFSMLGVERTNGRRASISTA